MTLLFWWVSSGDVVSDPVAMKLVFGTPGFHPCVQNSSKSQLLAAKLEFNEIKLKLNIVSLHLAAAGESVVREDTPPSLEYQMNVEALSLSTS